MEAWNRPTMFRDHERGNRKVTPKQFEDNWNNIFGKKDDSPEVKESHYLDRATQALKEQYAKNDEETTEES